MPRPRQIQQSSRSPQPMYGNSGRKEARHTMPNVPTFHDPARVVQSQPKREVFASHAGIRTINANVIENVQIQERSQTSPHSETSPRGGGFTQRGDQPGPSDGPSRSPPTKQGTATRSSISPSPQEPPRERGWQGHNCKGAGQPGRTRSTKSRPATTSSRSGQTQSKVACKE